MKIDNTQSALALAQSFADFIKYSEGRRSPCTIEGYRTAMKLFAEFASEKRHADMDAFGISFFTEDNVNAFVQWLRDEKGAKPQSCNLRLSQLRAFLKYMARNPEYRQYLLGIKDVSKLTTVDTSKVVEPLTKDAMKALAHAPGTDTATGLRYTTMISMLYTMACRIDEILSIKVGDLIFDSAKPHVTVIGKGRKSRTVYIMSRTVSLLKKYILMEHGKTPKPDAYLFFSHSKGLFSKVSERGVNKQLRIYAQIARIQCQQVPENVHSHQFRHSMATHCLDDGMNIFQISKMLGHKSVSTTMNYLGVTVAMTNEAVQKIESTTARTVKPVWKQSGKLKDLF